MNRIVRIVLAVLLVIGFSGLVACSGGADKKGGDTKTCACGVAKPAKPEASCSCPDMKKTGHGWCEHCGGGLCDGKPSSCKDCATAGKMCAACAAKAKEAPKEGAPAPK